MGDQQDYGMRIYDPRVGRFLSVDPITKKYPELTPFQFASNRPIEAIDLDGLEAYDYNDQVYHRHLSYEGVWDSKQVTLDKNGLGTYFRIFKSVDLQNRTYTVFQTITNYKDADQHIHEHIDNNSTIAADNSLHSFSTVEQMEYDANKTIAEGFENATVGLAAIGAGGFALEGFAATAEGAAFARVAANVGKWSYQNLIQANSSATGLKAFFGFNAAAGAGDLGYQIYANGIGNVNGIEVGASTALGPLPGAIVSNTFSLTFNNGFTYSNPLKLEKIGTILLQTGTNYLGGLSQDLNPAGVGGSNTYIQYKKALANGAFKTIFNAATTATGDTQNFDNSPPPQKSKNP